MASAVFTEAILIIASVIVAAGLAGVVMTKVGTFQSTFTQATESQKQTILTNIKIIYTTNSSANSINAWVKNIGSYPILNPQNTDVYFGQINQMQRIPYVYPQSGLSWAFSSPVTTWNQANTLQMKVTNIPTIQCGSTYDLQVTTPNGVSDQQFTRFC
ncbi:MAG: flagellin [Thaumarchaeota archaeon]|nr:flagellin [Nitrososphaerota archaeon]MDE1872323.1 flagellin [Nitrososphaerota archaeon]